MPGEIEQREWKTALSALPKSGRSSRAEGWVYLEPVRIEQGLSALNAGIITTVLPASCLREEENGAH